MTKTLEEIDHELQKMTEENPNLVYAVVFLNNTTGEIVGNICCLDHLINAIEQIRDNGTSSRRTH